MAAHYGPRIGIGDIMNPGSRQVPTERQSRHSIATFMSLAFGAFIGVMVVILTLPRGELGPWQVLQWIAIGFFAGATFAGIAVHLIVRYLRKGARDG
jgi:hypothetical protein